MRRHQNFYKGTWGDWNAKSIKGNSGSKEWWLAILQPSQPLSRIFYFSNTSVSVHIEVEKFFY
jgi:hypothetical protein